jgi:hypothetical protein
MVDFVHGSACFALSSGLHYTGSERGQSVTKAVTSKINDLEGFVKQALGQLICPAGRLAAGFPGLSIALLFFIHIWLSQMSQGLGVP